MMRWGAAFGPFLCSFHESRATSGIINYLTLLVPQEYARRNLSALIGLQICKLSSNLFLLQVAAQGREPGNTTQSAS